MKIVKEPKRAKREKVTTNDAVSVSKLVDEMVHESNDGTTVIEWSFLTKWKLELSKLSEHDRQEVTRTVSNLLGGMPEVIGKPKKTNTHYCFGYEM